MFLLSIQYIQCSTSLGMNFFIERLYGLRLLLSIGWESQLSIHGMEMVTPAVSYRLELFICWERHFHGRWCVYDILGIVGWCIVWIMRYEGIFDWSLRGFCFSCLNLIIALTRCTFYIRSQENKADMIGSFLIGEHHATSFDFWLWLRLDFNKRSSVVEGEVTRLENSPSHFRF